MARRTLNLSRLPETKTRVDGLCECLSNQFFVYQTQCCGKKLRFSRCHSSDVLHEQLKVSLGEVFVEESDFHVHDLLMAEEV